MSGAAPPRRSGAAPPRRSGPAIAARGVEKHFGSSVALRPLDLTVDAGSTLAVLGPNGAGKSTLLRLLAGLARPSAGRLEVAGEAAGRIRRARVGFVAHATLLYPSLSSRENLELAGRLYGVASPGARAAELLARFELEAVAERRTAALSRGTAQRLAIARALVHDPPILLLDEPFVGLDVHGAERLAELLASLHRDERTIVLVTHDLARAASLADQVLLLVGGWSRRLPPERDPAALERAYRAALPGDAR